MTVTMTGITIGVHIGKCGSGGVTLGTGYELLHSKYKRLHTLHVRGQDERRWLKWKRGINRKDIDLGFEGKGKSGEKEKKTEKKNSWMKIDVIFFSSLLHFFSSSKNMCVMGFQRVSRESIHYFSHLTGESLRNKYFEPIISSISLEIPATD